MDLTKAKVWYEEFKAMSYSNVSGALRRIEDGESGIVILPYIGIKDVEGKPIYQGDVVLYTYPHKFDEDTAKTWLGVIEYDEEAASYRVWNDWYGNESIYSDVTLTLIGSSYEIPEWQDWLTNKGEKYELPADFQ